MDYLILGIVLVTLFFSLRTNYKISNVEEKQRKRNQQCKEDLDKTIVKLNTKVDSMEKRLIFLQKMISDYKESHESVSSKNINLLKKQLLALKSDTDLIKSIYLKTDIKKQQNSNHSSNESIQTELQQKEVVEQQPVVEVKSTQQDFHEKIKEKLQNMSGDEIWLLKQILSQEPLSWQTISQLQEEVSMPQFQIPKLSRKFIIDGLPVLMIKNAGDKMLVKWGDGLTADKIKAIQNEIRGDW